MERYSYMRQSQNVPNPSFSSSLLDSIYRSIDRGDEEVIVDRETMRKKQQMSCSLKEKNNPGLKDEQKLDNFERLQMIADGRRRCSSDSNNGCRFSSSVTEESVFRVPTNKLSSSSCYNMPKPIKTSVSIQQEKPKPEKKKSRAFKLYDDLKKSKQPISPGGKLASFLNSLFRSGHAKKSANPSTCSSASSFSRSCLSKTPSSSIEEKKASNVVKRSVTFYPISVVVDQDSQPCGHKNLDHDENKPRNGRNFSFINYSDIKRSVREEVKNHIMEKNRRVEEAAKNLLWNYQKRVEVEHDLRSRKNVQNQTCIDDDDDDDEASCGSSDLFELDNLSPIRLERYKQDLPVYGTTHLHTNIAISNQKDDYVTKNKNYK